MPMGESLVSLGTAAILSGFLAALVKPDWTNRKCTGSSCYCLSVILVRVLTRIFLKRC